MYIVKNLFSTKAGAAYTNNINKPPLDTALQCVKVDVM